MTEYATATASTAVVAGQLMDIAGASTSQGILSLKKYDYSTSPSYAPIGRATTSAAAGGTFTVELFDSITTLTAGAAISAGDDIAPSTAGKVITAVAGDVVVGRALTAASADGDSITVAISQAAILSALKSVTAGTAAASKAVVLNASGDITSGIRDILLMRALTTTGNVALGDGAGDTVKFHGSAGSGAQSAFLADSGITGSGASVTGSEASVTGGVSATTPGSGADGNTPNGAEWTAAVGDITDLYTTVTALAADSADLYTTVTALAADTADVYTTLAEVNTLLIAVKAALVNHGLMAAS